ncbi:lyso-ornithine lipid acyltransferase [Rhodothalassium salexigens DSM 2132]|uniref:Lyso-ornithine lipid acyltransferase n=1 Tax=Rhodothalassium salexigens DSM 2132 TaxID=1188247 RepID=A0A4R2PKY2_RHOSA|nr:lysophospholipid acyltransferase family protein [Rhodothalassium salexigens]MBK1640003.1 hypothetical protein [Rhodothalassium salexigens DSM 2132]TCP36249.1 lyso-ornithine lipid acyltransferase [Rhodothalassium salexigens DSM 2132]
MVASSFARPSPDPDSPAAPARRPVVKLTLVIAVLGLGTLPVLVYQSVVNRLYPRGSHWLPPLWHKLACAMIGVRVVVHGRPIRRGPCLFAANHLSWLDIPVLGSRIHGSFIAKSEVNDWGVFGAMARLQRTVFVNRERRSESRSQVADLLARFNRRENVILFAEGTSTDGLRTKPFKSALFGVAEAAARASDARLYVQPVTLAYTRINNMPLVRAHRPRLAWIGDMDLLPHFLDVLNIGRVTAVIQFHEPIPVTADMDRKTLARRAEAAVARGLDAANARRVDDRRGQARSAGDTPA